MVGLGVALTGCESHEEICRLAQRGDRGRVDLRVGDIYREGEIALPGDTTAASFGNLARWLSRDSQQSAGSRDAAARPEDLAAAVMGLVGENVALVCCGLAAAAGLSRLVYGGATLHDNPALVAIVKTVSAGLGREPILLENGSFAGAVGALEWAAEN
jgi:type II pantothenate kinase